VADRPVSGRERALLLALAVGAAALLGISPYHRRDWALELIAPALMVAAAAAGSRWFVFTRLAYWLILAHVLVQLWGGHFTYGREPLFGWLQARLGLARNHYDRLAHFALGFLLWVPVREMILRLSGARRGWAGFLAVAVLGAVGGLWEVFEWGVVSLQPGLTEAYLGLQGDVWDAQKDIALAFVGALAAWPVFGAWHDAQLRRALPAVAAPAAEV
jgi:putative membrane protein